MLLTSVKAVDHVKVLPVVNQVARLVSSVTVLPTSVLTVDTAVVLAATCAAATGQLFATFAAMVLVLYTTAHLVVLMATLEQVKCGVKVTTAGTSS